MLLLLSITLVSGLAYRRYWKTMSKNRLADRHSPIHSLGHSSSLRTHERFSEIGHMPSGTTSPNHTNSSSSNRAANAFRSNVSMFGGSLHKTFATGWVIIFCFNIRNIFNFLTCLPKFKHLKPFFYFVMSCRNLARMCQLPVMNPMRSSNTSNGPNQFEDPSEPIYTDPSLFERSRFVQTTAQATIINRNAQLQKQFNLS